MVFWGFFSLTAASAVMQPGRSLDRWLDQLPEPRAARSPPRRAFVFTATGNWKAGAGAVALSWADHPGFDGTGARCLPCLPRVARELPWT